MSEQNASTNLPLWASAASTSLATPPMQPPYTPAEHGAAGAADALAHATDHAPAFVLKALGDALLAQRGFEFTAETVRVLAEQSEAVKGWLAVKGREACYGGWFMTHAKIHRLRATGALRRAERKEARGRKLPVWRFP